MSTLPPTAQDGGEDGMPMATDGGFDASRPNLDGGDGAIEPTTSFVYASGFSSGEASIRIFAFDHATSSLAHVGDVDGGANPSFLAWNQAHDRLFAVQEIDAGEVVSFAIDASSGALSRIDSASSGGKGPTHLALDRSGSTLFVANYAYGTTGVVTAIPVDASGRFGTTTGRIEFGHNALPHQIVPDADDAFVLVPCAGSDSIAQLVFDRATGSLAANAPPSLDAANGSSPRHLAFHPERPFVYVIHEKNSTVSSLAYDRASGVLTARDTVSTLPAGTSIANTGAELAVHPNGRFVYASNRGHDSLAIFEIEADGRLTLLAHETGDGAIRTPRHFSLDETGRHLIVASQASDQLVVFRVDPATGRLDRAGEPVDVPGLSPSFVGILSAP